MKKYRIGVDIGGTNIKIALVDLEGKIIYSNTVPTRAEMGFEAGVANIKQAIKDLMQADQCVKYPSKTTWVFRQFITLIILPLYTHF